MADKTRKASAEDYQHYLKHGHFPNEPKPSKYGNTKIEWGGETFDSKLEWTRWMVLMQMEAEGKIRNLKRQVTIMLQPSFETSYGEHVRPILYIADFTYIEPNALDKPVWNEGEFETSQYVIEDAKGFETDVFKLKWKMLKYLHRGGTTKFVLSRKGESAHGQDG